MFASLYICNDQRLSVKMQVKRKLIIRVDKFIFFLKVSFVAVQQIIKYSLMPNSKKNMINFLFQAKYILYNLVP